MVDAIVSAVLDQLVTLAIEEAKQPVRLVTGVDQEVEMLKSNLQAIQAVLVDAEQRQHKEEAIRLWLDDFKHASYDMEDVLDEWITAILKRQIEGVHEKNGALVLLLKKKVCSFFPVASYSGFKRVLLRPDIASKIKSINQTLDEMARQKDRFNLNVIRSTAERSEWIPTTSIIEVFEVLGREEEKETLKRKLLSVGNEQQNAVQIISVVGKVGIGKTTLARFAFNDIDVINNFDTRIWVCVSEPFDEFRISKAILKALACCTLEFSELQPLLRFIRRLITGKKLFLVLDDVCTVDVNKWEQVHNCLIGGGRGSKILVTTRKESIAQMMESTDDVSIRELSERECWSLFKRFAFFGRSIWDFEQLEKIGRNIVVKCKGSPLAVKTMGSLLRFKRSREEWQSILESELWQLEEFEGCISPALLLSFNDLPSKIKQCFSYCAVFLKDYNIEKDELIRLWMAQGYIKPEGDKEMEIVGEEYFNYLASRSFFQEFRKDDDDEGIIISCKMHDVVHDFAQFLTKNECFAIDSNNLEKSSFEKKLRHLTLPLVITYKDVHPISIIRANKLRSLLVDGESKSIPDRDTFEQLTFLRTLKIVNASSRFPAEISEIPQEIKKLTHLRYLKLVGIGIENLPETCCELLNLQTLEMVRCNKLRALPQGIGKLINLRHLIFDSYARIGYMPKGIERLTSLRTLSKFVENNWCSGYSKAGKLDALKHLNHLRGSIRIELNGNVRNIDEAKNVDLEKKKNLVGLEIDFHMNLRKEAEYEAVCEALRPPENLESLYIARYGAVNRWPNWIVSLHKLKKLILNSCRKCEIMPPLAKLPSLEMLKVCHLQSVKRVGDEFLGIEEERDDVVVLAGTSSSVIAFPKLKQLIFDTMAEWEEWDFGKEDVELMPQLNYLCFEGCKKLRSLPEQLLRSKTLETLRIVDCPILKDRFKKDTGEDWSKISHVPNVRS